MSHPLRKICTKYYGYYYSETYNPTSLDAIGNPLTEKTKHEIVLLIEKQGATNLPNAIGINSGNVLVNCTILRGASAKDLPTEIYLQGGQKLIVVDRMQQKLKVLNRIFGDVFSAILS